MDNTRMEADSKLMVGVKELVIANMKQRFPDAVILTKPKLEPIPEFKSKLPRKPEKPNHQYGVKKFGDI